MIVNAPGTDYRVDDQRFWARLVQLHPKIRTRVAVDDRSGCWPWRGDKGRYGYGLAPADAEGRRTGAHRLLYQELVGPIDPELTLDHLCRNRICVNPAHMEPVSRWESVRRGTNHAAQGLRRSTCPRGHPYDMVDGRGWRKCRTCRNALDRARRSGVAVDVRHLVQLRASHRCERCQEQVVGTGGQIHHRRPRAMGGSRSVDTNQPQNLVLLCLACHQWTEQNRERALLLGLLVRQGGDPATAPLFLRDGRLVYLTLDGRYELITR